MSEATEAGAGEVPVVEAPTSKVETKIEKGSSKRVPVSKVEADEAMQQSNWQLVQELDAELALYREMAMQLASWQSVQVPDCVKDPNLGLGKEESGRLREWLASLLRSVKDESMSHMATAVRMSTIASLAGKSDEAKGDDAGKTERLKEIVRQQERLKEETT